MMKIILTSAPMMTLMPTPPSTIFMALVPLLQVTNSGDAFLSFLSQAPFFGAVIWLFLRLVHIQKEVLTELSQRNREAVAELSKRNNEMLRYLAERFEIMDERRDNHNYAIMSALLAAVSKGSLKPDELEIFEQVRQDELKARERKSTKEFLLGKT